MCPETFSSTEALWIFRIVAPLQSLICVLGIASWLVVRAPVLLHRIARKKQIDRDVNDIDHERLMKEMTGTLKETLSDIEQPAVLDRIRNFALGFIDAPVSRVVTLITGVGVGQHLAPLVLEPEFILNVFKVTSSIMGLTYSPFFYTFHLFAVVHNS